MSDETTGRALQWMDDLELVLSAECEGHERHEPAYVCHTARKVLARRVAEGLDLAAVRRQIALAVKRLRELPDDEIVYMSILDEGALTILATRESQRRANERGYPPGWTRESWEHREREIEKQEALMNWTTAQAREEYEKQKRGGSK